MARRNWLIGYRRALPYRAARDFAAGADAPFHFLLSQRVDVLIAMLSADAVHAAHFDRLAATAGLPQPETTPPPYRPLSPAKILRMPAVRRNVGNEPLPPPPVSRLRETSGDRWDLAMRCQPDRDRGALRWNGEILTPPAAADGVDHLFVVVTRADGALTPRQWAAIAAGL